MAILMLLVLLLAYCQHIENPKSYFATYKEAKDSGIMDQGWIPTYIPESSREIHETHNLDTNRVKMSFKYNPGDVQGVEENCFKKEITGQGTSWFCSYSGTKAIIELNDDGTVTLSTMR